MLGSCLDPKRYGLLRYKSYQVPYGIEMTKRDEERVAYSYQSVLVPVPGSQSVVVIKHETVMTDDAHYCT
jgi:hypothetical protein